jgi:hypothetical protein
MKATSKSVTLCILLLSTHAQAECPPPNAAYITIPDPSCATRGELLATQESLKAFDAAMSDYLKCIDEEYQNDASQKDLTKERRRELSNEYARRRDAAIEAVQQLAERFNAAVKAYKAKSN